MSEEQKNSDSATGGLQIKKLITYYNKGASGNTGAAL
jgi:hypothetical protein